VSVAPVRPLPLDRLRERTSEKWREYPADVLPLFVAESDFPLAPAVTAALRRAVELGDTGYTASRTPLAAAFAGFARRRFGWEVDPAGIRPTADVSMGIVELLRRVTRPGDRVVVTPPVYPPFYDLVDEAGAVVERVPLAQSAAGGWALDLPGIEAALAGGARAVLLCNPHNPTGTVHPAETLAALAELAKTFGAAVISDEIHAALTYPGTTFTPFLAASPAAAEVGFAVTSASKAFNLAGLKCALMITAGERSAEVVRGLPIEVEWRTGQFGMLAGTAAFSDGDDWLDGVLVTLDRHRRLLAELLAEKLPAAVYRVPDAGYLAWIDLRGLGWGDDPARRILRDAKVALHFGPHFGDEGRGFVRLNFACAEEVLSDAVRRMGALARS
jgi:cystathionine beta-lyase